MTSSYFALLPTGPAEGRAPSPHYQDVTDSINKFYTSHVSPKNIHSNRLTRRLLFIVPAALSPIFWVHGGVSRGTQWSNSHPTEVEATSTQVTDILSLVVTNAHKRRGKVSDAKLAFFAFLARSAGAQGHFLSS